MATMFFEGWSYFDSIFIGCFVLFFVFVALTLFLYGKFIEYQNNFIFNPVVVGFPSWWSRFDNDKRVFIHEEYEAQGCEYSFSPEYCSFVQNLELWEF